MLFDIVAAQVNGPQIGFEQSLLALELFSKEFLKNTGINIQQNRQRADINNVFEQLALPGVAIGSITDLGQWHADDLNILAELGFGDGAGAVIKKVATGLNLGHVSIPGLGIHGNHHVYTASATVIAFFADTGLIPGW